MIQRAEQVGVPAELITAARAVNRTMPTHVFSVLKDILYKNDVPANNSNVLFLGWSYKAEVGDHRETPAEHLALALTESGIKVSVWDPHLENDVYPNNVNVEIKNFPLGFHKQAYRAAQYALAAHQQGKYQEMYHAIFLNYKKLKENQDWPLEIAQSLGLNMEQFLKDFSSDKIKKQIDVLRKKLGMNEVQKTVTNKSFDIGSYVGCNATGQKYVAYVFAHDPEPGSIIKCENYTGNAVQPKITLAWKPH